MGWLKSGMRICLCASVLLILTICQETVGCNQARCPGEHDLKQDCMNGGDAAKLSETVYPRQQSHHVTHTLLIALHCSFKPTKTCSKSSQNHTVTLSTVVMTNKTYSQPSMRHAVVPKSVWSCQTKHATQNQKKGMTHYDRKASNTGNYLAAKEKPIGSKAVGGLRLADVLRYACLSIGLSWFSFLRL